MRESPPADPHAGEAARIAREYTRRAAEIPAARYALTSPGPLFVRQATERAVVRALGGAGLLPLESRRVLEVGCGDGAWLLAFEAWGAARARLAGIDLLEGRVDRARERLAGAELRAGDATRLPWPDGRFDVVFQSMMLSSIADAGMRRAVAAESARVLAPGGSIVSYDFCVDNPRNRRVRAVTRAELRRLFPGFEVRGRRAVLAPPVARRLAGLSWTAATLLQATTLANTQLVAVLRREGGRA
ncbi:MAG: hypothetical protein QOE65_1909 [Solirubrobacteraceae bacterium]|nr:hypothetical protein [Solirubrobacteraceae bacterium]